MFRSRTVKLFFTLFALMLLTSPLASAQDRITNATGGTGGVY